MIFLIRDQIQSPRIKQAKYHKYRGSETDVGGQRCPDSVRVYYTVSVRQNLKFSVGRVFECPDFEFELDFDRQTPHSKSRQNPDSAVRRRLFPTTTTLNPQHHFENQ